MITHQVNAEGTGTGEGGKLTVMSVAGHSEEYPKLAVAGAACAVKQTKAAGNSSLEIRRSGRAVTIFVFVLFSFTVRAIQEGHARLDKSDSPARAVCLSSKCWQLGGSSWPSRNRLF